MAALVCLSAALVASAAMTSGRRVRHREPLWNASNPAETQRLEAIAEQCKLCCDAEIDLSKTSLSLDAFTKSAQTHGVQLDRISYSDDQLSSVFRIPIDELNIKVQQDGEKLAHMLEGVPTGIPAVLQPTALREKRFYPYTYGYADFYGMAPDYYGYFNYNTWGNFFRYYFPYYSGVTYIAKKTREISEAKLIELHANAGVCNCTNPIPNLQTPADQQNASPDAAGAKDETNSAERATAQQSVTGLGTVVVQPQ